MCAFSFSTYIRKVNKGFAQFISYVAHPGLMPLVGVVFVLLLTPQYIGQNIFFIALIYVFLGTYFFPFLLVLVLRKIGLLSSLHMHQASERRLPYLTAGLFYFITAQSLRSFPIPEIIPIYLLSGVLILFICLLLLGKIKISIHMAGVGALIGLVIYTSYFFGLQLLLFIAALILLAGLVGTSRLLLRAHSPTEVYLGFFLGLIASICLLAYL
jgi:membrane-associated phospholipid phosphatase